MFDSHPFYLNAPQTYALWFYSTAGTYVLTDAPGNFPAAYWDAPSAEIPGTYTPAGTALGDATVTRLS